MIVARFAAIVARARHLAGWSPAELDFQISRPNPDLGAFGPYGWLDLAAHQLGTNLEAHWADVEAMTAAAKAKSYTGWSTASSRPIRYAEDGR